MTDEPEWRDANPSNDNLPGKGRTIITFITGGVALLIIAIVGARVRPIGLAVGSVAFLYGLMTLVRRRRLLYKPGLIVTACGFLLLLANPRFGVVAGFAGYFLVVTAIALVVFGLFKAIKLSWELGKWS